MTELSQGAQFALMVMKRDASLNTPDLIANGRFGIEQVDVADVTNGLHELAAAGLVVEQHGRWQPTDAGRDS